MKSLNEEVFSTSELEEGTSREREVRINPESRKDFVSHKKPTRELHPGKYKKRWQNLQHQKMELTQEYTTPTRKLQPIRWIEVRVLPNQS